MQVIGFPYSLNTVNAINIFEFYESKKWFW